MISDELRKVQNEIHVPKNQWNAFGKYHYRSLEDIEAAAKPLLDEHGLTLMVTDDIVNKGERYYIEATATVSDKDGNKISTKAYAREPVTKKGMDEGQITGMASSYARKYALGGLLLLDDRQDSDDQNNTEDKNSSEDIPTEQVITPKRRLFEAMKNFCGDSQPVQDLMDAFEIDSGKSLSEWTDEEMTSKAAEIEQNIVTF